MKICNDHRSKKPDEAGFTVVELLAVLVILGLLMALLLPAIQAVRETSRSVKCRNHLHQFGTAIHSFAAVRDRFPSPVGELIERPKHSVGASPHSALLDYLELRTLRESYKRSGANRFIELYLWLASGPHVKETIPVFLCPSDLGSWGTNYVFCTGAAMFVFGEEDRWGAFADFQGSTESDIQDGLSNTAAVSEQLMSQSVNDMFDPEVHYWFAGLEGMLTPAEIEARLLGVCQSLSTPTPPFDETDGWQWYIGSYGRTWYNHAAPPNFSGIECSAEPYPAGLSMFGVHPPRSRHPGGVILLVMDGAVRFANDSIDESVWQAAATINGAEPLGAW